MHRVRIHNIFKGSKLSSFCNSQKITSCTFFFFSLYHHERRIKIKPKLYILSYVPWEFVVELFFSQVVTQRQCDYKVVYRWWWCLRLQYRMVASRNRRRSPQEAAKETKMCSSQPKSAASDLSGFLPPKNKFNVSGVRWKDKPFHTRASFLLTDVYVIIYGAMIRIWKCVLCQWLEACNE